MELKLGVIADAANVADQGKLNILGEFNQITSTGPPPVIWPMFTLVARLEAPTVEGTQHKVGIDLVDGDGKSILPGRIEGPIKFSAQGPGRPLRANLIAQLQGMIFPAFGTYEFHIIVDGRSVGTIPVHIVQMKPPTGQPG